MMRVHLLYQDNDFDPEGNLPSHAPDVIQDLGLVPLFEAMARDDEFLLTVARRTVLDSLTEASTIYYRQAILQDCLDNPAVVREIYQIAVTALENRRRSHFGIFTRTPSGILYESVKLLEMFMGALRQLRQFADEHQSHFHSEGFSALIKTLQAELSDVYLAQVEGHLKNLSSDNIFISAKLGKGNRGTDYTLVKPEKQTSGFISKLLSRQNTYTFRIHERDDNGARALGEIKDRGLNIAANALAQSADHILAFFYQLRAELAFYVGCLNLYESIQTKGEGICFPLSIERSDQSYDFQGLYDLGLRLRVTKRVVANDLDDGGNGLIVITGANQGGKSTFLRSIGIAQMMMQCGMFVPAASFSAHVYKRLFTHFRREEDAQMESGKLDEELNRMNKIVDNMTSDSLILFNESFAATNEREGSEIAAQVTQALLDNHVKVVFVTHFFAYAQRFLSTRSQEVTLLRAERESDGRRTFRIQPGVPLKTGYGIDLYNEVFDGL